MGRRLERRVGLGENGGSRGLEESNAIFFVARVVARSALHLDLDFNSIFCWLRRAGGRVV